MVACVFGADEYVIGGRQRMLSSIGTSDKASAGHGKGKMGAAETSYSSSVFALGELQALLSSQNLKFFYREVAALCSAIGENRGCRR